MRTGGAWRGSTPNRGAPVALAALAAALLAGCGSSDFANEPRPPVPIEVAAKVDNEQVVVSPSRFGAGLATFTIANLSDSPVKFVLSGKTSASTGEIDAGGTANLKVQMDRGSYLASASRGIKPDKIEVGPERKGAQNKLLLP